MFSTRIGIVAATILFAANVFADTYTIDKDHSSANFTIRHIVSKVRGSFTDLSGTINYDEKDPSKGSVEAVIKTASIDTHVAKRDNHLKSGDFFDVEKYPDMKFTSKKIVGKGKKFKVEGLLSLHGVEKPVTLDAEFLGATKTPMGDTRAGFSASTTINRKDFGLKWNKPLETGGVMVGDDVTINLEIEAVREQKTAGN